LLARFGVLPSASADQMRSRGGFCPAARCLFVVVRDFSLFSSAFVDRKLNDSGAPPECSFLHFFDVLRALFLRGLGLSTLAVRPEAEWRGARSGCPLFHRDLSPWHARFLTSRPPIHAHPSPQIGYCRGEEDFGVNGVKYKGWAGQEYKMGKEGRSTPPTPKNRMLQEKRIFWGGWGKTNPPKEPDTVGETGF